MSTEIITNIASLILGIILGNWLAIGRDKRKEFNEVADVVHLKLKKELKNVGETGALVSGPTAKDFENFKRRLPFFKKKNFTKALEKYRVNKTMDNWAHDEYNQPFYKDSKMVSESIEGLLKFTDRRKYFPL